MTGEEFKQALKVLGWTQRGLAKKLGLHYMTVYAWAKSEPPQWAVEYLRAMTALKALATDLLTPPKD